MHVGRGREHPLHVEYIHIGACLSFIQDVFTEAILSHPRLDLSRKIALVKALGKVIWIQNDLFAKWYVRDRQEYADEQRGNQQQVAVEREGYLHGKKMIHEDNNDRSSSDTTPSTGEAARGSCPFSGMTVTAVTTTPKVDSKKEQQESITTKETNSV